MTARRVLAGVAFALLVLIPLTGDPYTERLATLGAIFAILALGLNLTAGHLGLFDFGYIVYFGLGGYTSALLTLKSGWSYWPALGASLIVVAVAAVLFGAIVLRLRGPYFVIATFSLLTIAYYVAINWGSLTNGALGLIGVPPATVGSVTAADPAPALWLAAAAMAFAGLVVWRLTGSSVGRAWHAIRDNEDLAASLGIAPTRYAFAGLFVSAVLGGLGGSLYGQYLGIVTPEIFAFGHMVDVLVMIVIGGTGTFFGPIVGSFLVIAIPELLRATESLRLPIFGLILIVTILFAPRGLAALPLSRLRRPARGRVSPVGTREA